MSVLDSFDTPAVSVVMPVYNGASTLKNAVESVLSQTFSNFELIICNDASTDETGDILADFADNRIRILHNTSNIGAGPSRDRAIDMARGKWFAVIDADDAWSPERLETLLKESNESRDFMIFDNILRCHDTTSGMVPWNVLRSKRAFGGDGINTVDVPVECFVIQKRLLIKPLIPLNYVKQFKVRHGFQRFAEDTEFFLQLLAYGLQLRYVPRPMYYYRITPGSMTGISNRTSLMRKALENSINLFEQTPKVQSALYIKVAQVANEEKYKNFILALKKKQLHKALKIAYNTPWLIIRLLIRSVRSKIYHMHRIRHGGRKRGVR